VPPGPAAARPRPAPAALPAIPDQPSRFAPAQDQPVREITGDDAWAAHQRRIPFLDARRTSEYLEGHVAGAWSVPVWEADAAARITEFEARANPAPAAPIVLYCSGGDCHDSRILAQRLVQLGYRNLLIYTDGWPDWIQHGRPRAQGARP
jgi:rhodanese-related sulfurtransferase